MTDLLRFEREHFAVFPKDGAPYTLAIHELASFLAAWKSGAAFWDGESIYGSRVYIKLGDVVGVVHRTDAALLAEREDEEIRKARDLLDGGA
jgi:hypothetical protein